jgi:hypothetical protein
VSSRYTIICLTHDPAINESGSDWGDLESALGHVLLGTGPAEAHRSCDVVIGRWSYPLIEVYCPPTFNRPASACAHSGVRDTPVGWLRLLHHSRINDDQTDRLVGHDASCWTAARLDRLEPLFRRDES